LRDTKDLVNVGHRRKKADKDYSPLEPVYTIRDEDNIVNNQYG